MQTLLSPSVSNFNSSSKFWLFFSKKRPFLRPPIATHVTCSIHCPNASGYPQLNCVSCQSLYHPACVGLGPNVDYMAYDFYCSTCPPPSGKENKPFTLGNSSTTITAAAHGPLVSSKAKTKPSVTLTPTGNTGPVTKKRSTGSKGAMPLRPIEAQSVVNIAGMKYLVVPHPDLGNSLCNRILFLFIEMENPPSKGYNFDD